MSFTSEIKKEITGLPSGRKCCQLAELTGLIRFSGSIYLASGKMGLKFTTDNPAIARLFISLTKDYFGTKTALKVEESQVLRKGKTYTLLITPEMNSEAILHETGILGIQEGSNYLKDGLEAGNYKKRCCKKSALRGIFLAAGSVTDPSRGYHLEISCQTVKLAADVKKLIASFGIKAKSIERRGKQLVYIKDAEQISEFLTVIGCSNMLFKFEDIRISKEMRNTANRINNCESANMDKTVNAAQKIIADINYIEEHAGADYLPAKLWQTALLRRDNPELSLDELAALSQPPIGKSGLNHRLAKIKEAADKLRGK